MRTKMNQLVNWGTGLIASPRQLLDTGQAEVRIVANWSGGRGRAKPRRAVFVDLKGTMTGVEVSGYVTPKTSAK